MPTPRSRLALLFALAALIGCDTGDAGTSDASHDDAETEVDDAQDSGGTGDDNNDNAGAVAPVLLLECGFEPACEVLSLPVDETFNKQRYDSDGFCVFDALTAPTPATLLQIQVMYPTSTANLDLALLDSNTLLRQSYGHGEEVGEWVNPPMRCALQGPEFFAACAKSYDPSCLDPESWVVGCEPMEPLICPTP